MILAGIDIGTNTLRLLIADIGPSSFHQLSSARTITRLGQGLDRSGVLTVEAQERSIAALAGFAEQVRIRSVRATAAVGTSALRAAANTSDFIHAVKRRTGIGIRVISGEEEARLTLKGVRHALGAGPAGRCMVIDIGGGSTEVILDSAGAGVVETSLPLGAVYLTERFLHHDPPLEKETALLRNEVRETLRSLDETAGSSHTPSLIGTAGTITTLAAMELKLEEYDPERINGFVLKRTALDRVVEELAARTNAGRRSLKGLEQGREDIILAGAIVVQEMMCWRGADRLLVSEGGLREGILLDLYEKLR